MVRCLALIKPTFAALWVTLSLLLTVTLWVAFARSHNSYFEETCYIRNVSIISKNCPSGQGYVLLTILTNYTSNTTHGPPVQVPAFDACIAQQDANSLAQTYSEGSTTPCYVNKHRGSDVELVQPGTNARALISAIGPTVLLLLAVIYCTYLCFGHRLRSDEENYARTVAAHSPAMFSILGAFPPETGGTPVAGDVPMQDARRLTPEEASRVIRVADGDVQAANLGEEAICVVCLEELQPGSGKEVAVLPCNHAFHSTCITTWLTKGNRLCPFCHFDLAKLARQPPGADVHVTAPTTAAGAEIGPADTTQTTQNAQRQSGVVAIDVRDPLGNDVVSVAEQAPPSEQASGPGARMEHNARSSGSQGISTQPNV